MYGLGGFVFLVFLWAIRKDLGSLWRRQLDTPSSTNFNPIEIVPPYDVNKDRVRKLTLSDRYFIPFRLSDTPPKGWRQMFFENWITREKASVFFEERELRLISELDGVERIFPGLKKAIETTNSDYLESRKQAEAKRREAEKQARAREEREVDLRQNISSTLKRLNNPTAADQ